MTIMEVSLLTGFYPNQDDLKQVTQTPPTGFLSSLSILPTWMQGGVYSNQGSWVNAPSSLLGDSLHGLNQIFSLLGPQFPLL